MKVFFRNIHLYLSLSAGIVIAIVCFTGAALVFEKEMQMFIYPERYRVEVGLQHISIVQLITTLQRQVPDAKVRSVKVYSDPKRSIEFNYSLKAEKGSEEVQKKGVDERVSKAGNKKDLTFENKPGIKPPEGDRGPTMQAFMNPYTGDLISQYDHRNSFFFTMFSLHRWLLMGDAGKLIVGISTSIFLFILITGIVLWWPKNKKVLQQRLKLKWMGRWKRINHDLHIVIGFYAAVFLFTFAFTGLAWSFQWFNDGIYWITGTDTKRPEAPASVIPENTKAVTPDAVYAAAFQLQPDAEYYTINLPREATASYSVTLLNKKAAHERASDQLYFDQYSGGLIGKSLFLERNLGQRTRSTFYPVHVGSIGGMPGRIIAFVACVAGFTFPVTGTILWISRLRKKKKKGGNAEVEEELEEAVV